MNVRSLQVDSSSSAARFRACRVFQARLDVSDLARLRISSVLTTESPPTRGWGLPKFHSQVLISYTWLPLRDPWLAAPGAVSTPEFEGLLMSRSILASVWNGRRVIAMKKARKERHPPKKVLCPTDVEIRDRRGFIQQMIMSYE
jgi:hypothetical protein